MVKQNKKGPPKKGDPNKNPNDESGAGDSGKNPNAQQPKATTSQTSQQQAQGSGQQSQGSGQQSQGSGQQSQGSGQNWKKKRRQQQAGDAQQSLGGPQQQARGGPQQQGRGGPQQPPGDAQQAWGGQQQQARGGPQQQDRGGPPQQPGDAPQVWGGPQQQDRGGPRQQGRGGPQQQPGDAQQAWGGPQQQARGGPQRQDRGGPQQQDRGGPRQQGRGGPQQQPGDAQQAWGGPQQQARGGPQRQDRGGPQQQGRGGPRQQGRGGPQQQPGDAQQARGGPQRQDRGGPQQQGRGGPQQPPGDAQQAWGGPQQQGRGGPQQPPGDAQQAWGGSQQQARGGPQQQGRGGPQQPPGDAQQAWGGQQQQDRGGPRQQGRGGPQQQPGDAQQAWGGPQQQARGGPQRQDRGGPQQQGRGGPQQPPGDAQQAWGGPQQQGRGGPPNQPVAAQQASGDHQQQMQRPQQGRQVGIASSFLVETNYVTLDLSKMPKVAYHYDVQIDPDRPAKFQRLAFYAFVSSKIPGYELAYDGKHSAYSVRELPDEILGQQFEIPIEKDHRTMSFKVAVKATDEIIDLDSLNTYHDTRIYDKPMAALQCIGIALNTPCHDHKDAVRGGRSFYIKPERLLDLGEGYELWHGLFQAPILGSKPLLNIDVSHKSFPSNIDIVRFYECSRSGEADLSNYLKGLRVIYTPPTCFNMAAKEYKFLEVRESSKKASFKLDDGKEITVAAYYQSKGYRLQKPDLPCLRVGSTVREILIPLELISVPPGQAILRKDTDNQIRKMCEYAATASDIRKQKILYLLQQFQHNRNPMVQRFGITIGSEFIKINARMLSPPNIMYRTGSILPFHGEWRMANSKFLECPKKSDADYKWAILNISLQRDITKIFIDSEFVPKIISQSRSKGMSLHNECSAYSEAQPRDIQNKLKEMKTRNIDIVFVVLPNFNDSYANVKKEAELSCGIVTQCIKNRTMRNMQRGSMTIDKILMKVNTKLNGVNHRIDVHNQIKLQNSKIMYIGADVSHPSPTQRSLPSIVGVVGSHDLYGSKYNMQYRLQKLGEKIEDMNDIFKCHLNEFKDYNQCYPDHVFYYRDGVGDGDFPIIESYEIGAMRAVCKAVECNPKFTCIVAVKRHHTRFFPIGDSGEGQNKNVRAGTLVDETIVHPDEQQFYLVSHEAIKGTPRPTRYNVIVDDANIALEDIQRLTYDICHSFPRCTRSVSYPTPTYLAHLAAKRGRAYVEGARLNLDNLKSEYSRRTVSPQIMKANPMYFV